MEIVADLHLHSKFSRAVSPNMNLVVMEKYARQKGINLLTTADWTHPVWFNEIQTELEESGEGIYKLKRKKILDEMGQSRGDVVKQIFDGNAVREPKFCQVPISLDKRSKASFLI